MFVVEPYDTCLARGQVNDTRTEFGAHVIMSSPWAAISMGSRGSHRTPSSPVRTPGTLPRPSITHCKPLLGPPDFDLRDLWLSGSYHPRSSPLILSIDITDPATGSATGKPARISRGRYRHEYVDAALFVLCRDIIDEI